MCRSWAFVGRVFRQPYWMTRGMFQWLCLTVARVGYGGGLRAWRGGLGLSGRLGSLGRAAGWGQGLDGEVGDHDGDDDERGSGDSGFRGQQKDDDGC